MDTVSGRPLRLLPLPSHKVRSLAISLILMTCLCSTSVQSYTCESCELTICPVLIECQYGIVKDPCNCCSVCAQGDGEVCGGRFDLEGLCGVGLFCDKKVDVGDILHQQSSAIGSCKACEDVVYIGCNLVEGICQCGESCTSPFQYAKRESCQVDNQSVERKWCSNKVCPTKHSEITSCPPDSMRPADRPSLDGCCLIQQLCECNMELCAAAPHCGPEEKLMVMKDGSDIPGTCCPEYRCVPFSELVCTVGNTTYGHGKMVTLDSCTTCRCTEGVLKCYNEECTAPMCTWSTKPDGQCCPICLGCVSPNTQQKYYNGEQWLEDRSCTSCTCKDGQTYCTAELCAPCVNPVFLPGQCCPICNDTEVVNFSSTTTEFSKELCQPTDCPSDCKFPIIKDLNGCAICVCADDPKIESEVCFTTNGKVLMNGDTWFDGCYECFCQDGKELCSLLGCPQLLCDQPITKPGFCCPSCAEDLSPRDGRGNFSLSCREATNSVVAIEESSFWQLDECTICFCHNNQALCETQRCPPTLCSHPIKIEGDCCAVCPDDTNQAYTGTTSGSKRSCVTSYNTVFDHGDVWKMGDCQSCLCRDGAVTCFSQVCPTLHCSTTILKKGECCPQCTADHLYDRVCVYKGTWYKHGHTWEDDSSKCTCVHGNIQCSDSDCIPCENNKSDPICCENIDNGATIPMSIGLPVILVFCILSILFAIIIIVLLIVVLKHRKQLKSRPTGIPGILQQRAINNSRDTYNKKRPKSTNLEFLHATNDNKYNIAVSRGDVESIRPLMDPPRNQNEYIHC